ncbi:unnamed protein product [Prorocentrum cordatum]|uniref:Uncharacterized protein n=1 Tax=Prorocentrum cordatum TaxID=2364126 RepID=A0ABN9U2K1_9DINO|nr:unnamed protein product [Polarella glacialis]
MFASLDGVERRLPEQLLAGQRQQTSLRLCATSDRPTGTGCNLEKPLGACEAVGVGGQRRQKGLLHQHLPRNVQLVAPGAVRESLVQHTTGEDTVYEMGDVAPHSLSEMCFRFPSVPCSSKC